MNAQSSANAWYPSSENYASRPSPARTSRGFSAAQRLSFAITE